MKRLKARIKRKRDARKARSFYEAAEHGVVTKIERARTSGFCWVNVDVDARDGMVFACVFAPSAIAERLRVGQKAALSVEFEETPREDSEGGDVQ